jgi:thiamine-phosphate pyrophosphorylase
VNRPLLAVVTDRRRLDLTEDALVRRLAWLAAAGVDFIQLRERDLSDGRLFDLTRRVVDRTKHTNARVLVNDRLDVAVAAGAAGVHLREDSVPAARVRSAAPPAFVISRAVHGISAARAAVDCDFVLFGTVYPSRGKPADHRAAGIEGLRAVAAACPVPVLAIGGVNDMRAAAVAESGASGIAAVEALLGVESAEDAARRVARLRSAFDSGSPVV